MQRFDQLGLHPLLVQTVADLGYQEPTPIQQDLIPLMLDGHDVVGQAQTGTGKTAAFTLPTLHRLAPDVNHVQALVLAPTRELAIQVAAAMHTYGTALNMRVLPVFGGQPYARQITRLNKGVDVVVGTPGRLLDLIQKGALDLSHVRTVVLDEADEMLSMGFIEDIEAILDATPSARQTALISATLPEAIRRLAARYLRDPRTCTVQRASGDSARIEHRAHLVNHHDKFAALVRLLEVEPVASALVFAETRIATAEVAARLADAGYRAEGLSGELSQQARADVLDRFRGERVQILVATDVAARGLDIDHVSHVFNVELPRDPEVYVHRVGRTGRAGRSGVAISLISPKQRHMIRRIEQVAGHQIGFQPLPGREEVERQRDEAALDKLRSRLAVPHRDRDLRMLTALVAEGFDPMDVAAAAVGMSRSDEDLRPVQEIGEVRDTRPARDHKSGRRANDSAPRDRGPREQNMVRLSLSTGRAHGVQPNQVVSALARQADIPGKTIGKILIRDRHTLVDVPSEHVDSVLAQTGSYRFGKHKATVERA
jgi:ATP-dependent RNA helicase DeaD